ncbi:MAG: glycoside hydrolase [Armatimonadetes bacterium]|nr:glycoside hydrolase [Armatimonadota bacterium]
MIAKAFALLVLLALATLPTVAQVTPTRYDCLTWRCIGPFRGGRTVGAEGVISQPNVLFIGVNNGGVWKTTDYGLTWKPIFDSQPTGSVGCLAVAQSRPNTIYVGSGEGLQRPDLSVGDGVYKTTDGGKSWVNTGLKDGLQISDICVDPKNPDRAFAAVLGHPYGPNKTRGLFRTLNGGKSWERVLYKDENTGAVEVALDPTNPNTVYCSLWAARQAPWENGVWQGTTSGLFKSTDGGTTWMALTKGLPTTAQGLGRIGFSVFDSKRLYATVDATTGGGIYRSDDGGKSWTFTNGEPRVWSRGSDFAEVRADPKQRDVVYAANTSTYKSVDAGKTFVCIKGAPGGDDYHTIWINPTNPQIILLAADQGATISVNGGETWSSWYNQPTAQFYHVSTDNQFPYWVYGGQQESGSVGIASRGQDGQITFRDWHPVGAEEYAYVAADPLNPDLIYGSKGSKYNKKTGEVTSIQPKIDGLRYLRTMPMLFSEADPHTLFLASNRLLKTRDGGTTWEAISPDLSRETWDVPASFAAVSRDGKTMQRRGVIYAVAPSPTDINVIWCGTDDGLLWLTQDGGKNWTNMTPPEISSWSKIAQLEASRFVPGRAYAAVNRLRCDDNKPYIYKTDDFGKTWKLIVTGLPDNAPVNTVREDPKKPGLLYCGTERMVWFSSDDGVHWNPLRNNMPATSIRDLVVHDDDLVVGTHGRSFWILDSITALRQLSSEPVALYAPTVAYLVDWNRNTDTPLPPEEPAGQNPPDGVVIDYYLALTAKEVRLEVRDAQGKVVRKWSSTDKPEFIDPLKLTVDPRWARPWQPLLATSGSHRFIWNLRQYAPASGLGMDAIWQNTPTSKAPWVAPGAYTLHLTVDGKTSEQKLDVKPDPRKSPRR